MTELILHNYFRSSTSVRVRVALNLKGLPYTYVGCALKEGAQSAPAFLAKNPQGLVPALEVPGGEVLTQSMAILEWLEETHPAPPLLPEGAEDRARVRALSYMIACEIHPLNNLRVLKSLTARFGADQDAVADWFRTWVDATMAPLEAMIAGDPRSGRFVHGDAPGMADICIYAQVWNNRRFAVDMTPYPAIARVFAACDALPAFANAAPPVQPDAE
jgi:maleylpyruvate isomerase